MRNFIFILLIIVLFFSPFPTFGETIKGKAKLLKLPDGKVIADLKRNTIVDCHEENGDYYHIYFITIFNEIIAGQNMVTDVSNKLKADTQLYDLNGYDIGIIKSKVKLKNTICFQFRGNIQFGTVLSGYVKKASIDETSIVEKEFKKILDSSDNLPNFIKFKPFIERLKFEKWIVKDEYHSYKIEEIKKSKTETSPRFTLIFKNNELISLIFSRKIDLKDKYKIGKIDNNYSSIFFTEIDDATKEKLSHIFFKKMKKE